MKYFFILGNNPTLSIAEISAIFPDAKNKEIINESVFVIDVEKEINAEEKIKKMGGTIKIGEIKNEVKDGEKLETFQEIIKFLNPEEGKFKYGISNYGKIKLNKKQLAMEIKNFLREKKISCRWVVGKEDALSSVIVTQNKLTEKGIEIVLIKKEGKLIIGKTLAVQPFKELSFRDYGRPARDDHSGMLPPKLAQVMINLSRTQKNSLVIDPFCGSGTVLTEAMIMGYKNLIGSDISAKAISDTQKNIEWITFNYELKNINYKLFNKSASDIFEFTKPQSVDAIITEPYLGPQREKINIKKITQELERLYSSCLGEFKKVLKKDGRIVMIFPEFHISGKTYYISPNINGLEIVNPIPRELINNEEIKLTRRNTMIYGRPNQKIWREIIILK